MAELAAFEEAEREGVDAVFDRAYDHLDDFMSYVWFVLSALTDEENEIEDVAVQAAAATFAYRQVPPHAQQRYLNTARTIGRRYSRTDEKDRRRFAAAGTSLGTARELASIAQSIAESAVDWPEVDLAPGALRLFEDGGYLDRLLSLPEHTRIHIRNQRGGIGTREIAVTPGAIVGDWVEGRTLDDIAATHLGEVRDPVFRSEQLADFLTATCENFLPWVLGTAIGWANEELEALEEEARVCRDLPAFVRYGVASTDAAALLRAGVLSRATAQAVADAYNAADSRDETVREWLRSMSVADWRQQFAASATDLRALLHYCRIAGSRFVPDLLDEVEVEVPLGQMEGVAHGVHAARIAPLSDDPDPPRLGLWVDEELTDVIPAAHTDDLEAALRLGLPLVVRLSVSQSEATLLVSLETVPN
jgi:hypothetical protein